MSEDQVGQGERIFKNREFAVFARRQRIADVALCRAVEDVRRGLIDADLGGGVMQATRCAAWGREVGRFSHYSGVSRGAAHVFHFWFCQKRA